MSSEPAEARDWKAPEKKKPLNHDVINPFFALKYAIDEPEEMLPEVDALPTFEEYISSVNHAAQADRETEVARIIAETDSDKIDEYNALVAEVNGDLERIKKEEDIEALKNFYNRAEQLIRPDRAN